MGKIIEATCSNETVKIDGQNVNANILSHGKGSSEGAAILDKEKIYYVTSNADDLKEVIEKIISALNAIVSASSAWGETGAKAPVDLASEISDLTSLKDNLK